MIDAERWKLLKLIVAIVQDYDAPEVLRAMIDADYRVTQVSSTGGFLRAGNTTFLSGVDDDAVNPLLTIIAENCAERVEVIRPSGVADFDEWYPPDLLEVEVGGATVFICKIERFERVK